MNPCEPTGRGRKPKHTIADHESLRALASLRAAVEDCEKGYPSATYRLNLALALSIAQSIIDRPLDMASMARHDLQMELGALAIRAMRAINGSQEYGGIHGAHLSC